MASVSQIPTHQSQPFLNSSEEELFGRSEIAGFLETAKKQANELFANIEHNPQHQMYKQIEITVTQAYKQSRAGDWVRLLDDMNQLTNQCIAEGNTLTMDGLRDRVKRITEFGKERTEAKDGLPAIIQVFKEAIPKLNTIGNITQPTIIAMKQMNFQLDRIEGRFVETLVSKRKVEALLERLEFTLANMEKGYQTLKKTLNSIAFSLAGTQSDRFTLGFTATLDRLRDEYISAQAQANAASVVDISEAEIKGV